MAGNERVSPMRKDWPGADRSGPLAVSLASVFGAGNVPVAPGTAGSLMGLGLYLALPSHAIIQGIVLVFVIGVGIWSAGVTAELLHTKDPKRVVIDEVAGMLVACWLLPKTLASLCAAFLLFRLLDIGKWFPMRQLERLPGGWGIVADDLAAGALARCLVGALMSLRWFS